MVMMSWRSVILRWKRLGREVGGKDKGERVDGGNKGEREMPVLMSYRELVSSVMFLVDHVVVSRSMVGLDSRLLCLTLRMWRRRYQH